MILCIAQGVFGPLEAISALAIFLLLLHTVYLAFPCNRGKQPVRAFWLAAAITLAGFDLLWYLHFFARGTYADPGIGRALQLIAGFPITLVALSSALTVLHAVRKRHSVKARFKLPRGK